jgi:hypothetical protein
MEPRCNQWQPVVEVTAALEQRDMCISDHKAMVRKQRAMPARI